MFVPRFSQFILIVLFTQYFIWFVETIVEVGITDRFSQQIQTENNYFSEVLVTLVEAVWTFCMYFIVASNCYYAFLKPLENISLLSLTFINLLERLFKLLAPSSFANFIMHQLYSQCAPGLVCWVRGDRKLEEATDAAQDSQSGFSILKQTFWTNKMNYDLIIRHLSTSKLI